MSFLDTDTERLNYPWLQEFFFSTPYAPFFCPDKVCNSIREGVTVPRSHKKWSRAPRFFLFCSNLFSRRNEYYTWNTWKFCLQLTLISRVLRLYYFVTVSSSRWMMEIANISIFHPCKPWIGKWLIQYLIVVIWWFSVRARHASSRRFTTIWEGFVQTWS